MLFVFLKFCELWSSFSAGQRSARGPVPTTSDREGPAGCAVSDCWRRCSVVAPRRCVLLPTTTDGPQHPDAVPAPGCWRSLRTLSTWLCSVSLYGPHGPNPAPNSSGSSTCLTESDAVSVIRYPGCYPRTDGVGRRRSRVLHSPLPDCSGDVAICESSRWVSCCRRSQTSRRTVGPSQRRIWPRSDTGRTRKTIYRCLPGPAALFDRGWFLKREQQ